MRLEDYLITEDEKTEFYETAAVLGIICSDSLVKKINNTLNDIKSKKGINYDSILKDIKSEIKGGYDWSSQGVSSIKSLTSSDTERIIDACCIIKGMNTFMKEVGKKIVGSKPKFIHSRINDYYKAEKNALGEIRGAKANTADCIISNKDVDDILKAMTKGSIKPDKALQYITLGKDVKIIQVSLKKSSKGAQLGKITTFLKTNLDYGDDTESAVKAITEEFLGEGIWDRVKEFASDVWTKLKDAISSVVNAIKNKYLKIFKGDPNPQHVKDFFSDIGISESMEINEGVINAPTQKVIDTISKNPSLAINSVNKQLKKLYTMSSDSIPIRINFLKPVKKFKKGSESTETFTLISNYLTARTLLDMVLDSKDITVTVRRLVAEMLFGGTKLPLWKVYGDYGDGHAYTYLGTIDVFVGDKPKANVEVLGIKATPTESHYTITVVMLEDIVDKGKTYVMLRTGTNSSSRISFVFEGTKIIGPFPMNKSLISVLGK